MTAAAIPLVMLALLPLLGAEEDVVKTARDVAPFCGPCDGWAQRDQLETRRLLARSRDRRPTEARID